MRTYLRDIQSRLYLTGRGEWTTEPQSALDFKLIKRAIKHAERAGLQGVELVVVSADPSRLTALPVGLMRPALHKWHD